MLPILRTRFYLLPVLLSLFVLGGISPSARGQSLTHIRDGSGQYAELFTSLRKALEKERTVMNLRGRDRMVFVTWVRDNVHVMKAMKFLESDLSSHLELYLETQTPEGIYFDYFFPISDPVSHRMNLFDKRYWQIYAHDSLMMHRLPVEADLEYLMVEGVYYVWQATGDTAFVRKWLPNLERGINYSMSDPFRWSNRYRLIKRGYTLDTWDFMHLDPDRRGYQQRGGDVQEGIFDIGESTPMGIMHGDNSGLYAACRQLATLNRVLGNDTMGEIWDAEADVIRARTNALCWNGRYYAHFVEDDPQPDYYHMNQRHTLGLSNPYTVNRGMPTETMAESVVQTYLDLKQTTSDSSFAEWFGIYPAVLPHFSDYPPGSYMNGGVNTIVAGELAKAAFLHGYEEYGVDILNRILELTRKHDGYLPVSYRPDGTVDEGIPDNWGQAAVMSALIEGLAGVADTGARFDSVVVSPRWVSTGQEKAEVVVQYAASGKKVAYQFEWDRKNRRIGLTLSGDPGHTRIRLLLPEGARNARASVDGVMVRSAMESVRKSNYLLFDVTRTGEHIVQVTY